MNTPRAEEVRINSERDIVAARQQVREFATALGFGLTDVTRIVTAASELTRNIYVYAGSGTMRCLPVGSGSGLELTFEDHGPGIPDVAKAMEPGFSSNKSMGMGLPGSKRLMDEMEVRSIVGHGTTVIVRKWLKK